MTAIDYEAEYNNRARVPDFPEIQERWLGEAAAAREELDCEFDVAYGTAQRNRYDVVHPGDRTADAPLVAYIHGGYWQRGGREEYTGVARQLVARGVRVALPSYTLCPEAGVADIVAEMRAFCAVLWQTYRRRPVVIGHSAGGQLAAAMLATEWAAVGDVPDDLVRAAYSISGVFELAPLIGTSLNEALGLTPESAAAVSPLTWAPPKPPKVLVAAVGADESDEFRRQSLAISAAWGRAGVTTDCVLVPAANHFTVVDELGLAHSGMVARVTELAERASTAD